MTESTECHLSKWYCFFKFVRNNLEYIFDTKEEAEKWLKFWNYNPKCFIMEVNKVND